MCCPDLPSLVCMCSVQCTCTQSAFEFDWFGSCNEKTHVTVLLAVARTYLTLVSFS